MANNKFYGYTPKMNKPSGKEGTIYSGAEEGNTYENIGNRLDRVNPYEFRKGMDYELVALGCMRLAESTPEEREKATEKVLKNLENNGGYYTSLITYESIYKNPAEGVKKPTFKKWLEEQDDLKMKPVIDDEFKKIKDAGHKNDKMEELKEAIKKELQSVLKEKFKRSSRAPITNTSDSGDIPQVSCIRNEECHEGECCNHGVCGPCKKEVKYNYYMEQKENDGDFDDDVEKADKAATKGAKKVKSGNRFDLEKLNIEILLWRGKDGKDTEYTKDEPAPGSILAKKDELLDLYKSKYKGTEGGNEKYQEEISKANDKFEKVLEKHVKTYGEEGKGNIVTMNDVFGATLPDTIKALGARLKAIEKEEQEDVVTKTNERYEIAKTDMTREQHIKLLEIIRDNGISLREGAMGVKTYYEIAKAAYLEGLSNGLRI